MAMRVDQPGKQRLFTKIENLAGGALVDNVEFSNLDNRAGGSRAT